MQKQSTQLEIQLIKLQKLIKLGLLDLVLKQIKRLTQLGFDLSKCSIFNKIKRVQDIVFKLQKCLNLLNSTMDGWTVTNISQKAKFASKVTGTQIQMRYQQIFDKNIINLFAMVYLTGLYSQWVLFCQESINVKQPSPLQKIAYLNFKIPFLTNRCSILHGFGIDRIQFNDSVVIYCQGITSKKQLLEQQNIKIQKYIKLNKFVELDIKFGVAEVSYQGGNFIFKGYGCVDSHMPYIPGWAITFIMKKTCKFFAQKLIKQANNFEGSIWQKQLKKQQNNKFYHWLKERIETWMMKKSI